MKQLEVELSRLLMQSCKGFLQHGLSHALAVPKVDCDDTQAIINVQASLETLAKLYQLRNAGARAILEPRHHRETEGQLLAKLHAGSLKTAPYSRARDYVQLHIGFFGRETDLLRRFQENRNSLAHLGLAAMPRDVDTDVVVLLVRIVNTLSWDDSMPAAEVPLENHASRFLGADLFARLLMHPSYRDEACDLAALRSTSVRKCPECSTEAWGETDRDVLLCFACGYSVPDHYIAFCDCPECGASRSAFYDILQGHGVMVPALCTKCDARFFVATCDRCDTATEYLEPWQCEVCSQDP